MTETKQKQEVNLVQKLARIQRELKAPKGQTNDFAHFNYRSCEDILEAVKPFLEDLILIVSDDIVQVGDRYYVKATASLIDTNEKVLSNTAYARESETKSGMDSAQITGAASSYARKYALNGLFAIDDTKDADSQDNSTKAKPAPTPVQKVVTKNVATQMHEDKEPAEIFDGELPVNPHMDERIAFTDDDGKPVRDALGHAACVGCGKPVGNNVEEYSMKNYGRVLCVPCQAKEKAKNAKPNN